MPYTPSISRAQINYLRTFHRNPSGPTPITRLPAQLTQARQSHLTVKSAAGVLTGGSARDEPATHRRHI